MKKLLSICAAVAAVALLSVQPAQAQFFGGIAKATAIGMSNTTVQASTAYTWILPNSTGSTNTISGSVAPVIDVRNGGNVAFQLSFAGTNTSTAAVTLYLVDSPDKIHWSTIPKYAVSGNLAGNAAVVAPGTNFNFGAELYLAPLYLTNSSGDVMITNVIPYFITKPGI